MAARRPSRDHYLSPNRAKMPDVFVIQDYSVPTSGSLYPSNSQYPPSLPSTSPVFTFQPGAFLSPGSSDSLNKRSSSTVSSIFDLSIESDLLDRALRENDANAVSKFLQLHHGKFPISRHGSSSCGDRHSNDSRSRRPSSRTSGQDADLFFRRTTPTYLERYDIDRRESVTPECDIPDIFRTSIHIAVLNGAIDVLKILLNFGIDPNEPSANLINSIHRRRLSSFYQDSNKQRPACLIEEGSENSTDDSHVIEGDDYASGHSFHGAFERKSSQSQDPGGEAFKPSFVVGSDYEVNYTQEELFKLPPLYIAVQEKRYFAVNCLLRFGANANVQDRQGQTPLHLAATEACYNAAVCKHLLRHGAKTRISNNLGQTALELKPNLSELQKDVIKDLLSGKSSTDSLDKDVHTLKVTGKRISWSSNSDSKSGSFGRVGSIKKKLFGRGEGREKERLAKQRRRNESTSTGGTDSHFDPRDYASSASSHRSIGSRSRLHSTAVTEDLDSETFLAALV